MMTDSASLKALLIMVLVAAATPAVQASDKPIVLNLGAPEQGQAFACRVPVDLPRADRRRLVQFDVVAKAYAGDTALGSTGLATGERPLIRHREDGTAVYEPVPLQFDLTQAICDDLTELRIVFARCTFSAGETVDCLDRLRVEPRTTGEVAFTVGPAESME